jgi:hypothetical protein
MKGWSAPGNDPQRAPTGGRAILAKLLKRGKLLRSIDALRYNRVVSASEFI